MNCSKDVRLESDGAIFHFNYLDWDTKFFGKRSFVLDMSKSRMKPSDKIARLFSKAFKDCFVTAKLDSSCGKAMLTFLRRLGFKRINTEVVLKHRPMPPKQGGCDRSHGKVRVTEIKKNKDLPYERLGSSFKNTRFHKDKNISTDKADKLWVNYIKNYRPMPSRHMFIARVGPEVAGAILANENNSKNEVTLSFVAVLDKFRNMGIGSQLINHIVGRFKFSDIFTETQMENKGAMNFYIKNGFSKIDRVRTILHRW